MKRMRAWGKAVVGDLADRTVYLIVRILICIIQALPLAGCVCLSRGIAFVLCDLLRIRRKVILGNLAKAFPESNELERLAVCRGMWSHLFLMVCEIAHVPRKLHRSNWQDYIYIPDRYGLVSFLLDERPRVIVAGHFGNFEVAGYMCGMFGFPTYTIARPFDNPYLHKFINRFRGATGQFMIPKQGASGPVQEVLDSGEMLALLGDQHAGPKGCWVEFFGQPTSCHKAVALFALSAHAPLLVAYARRQGKPLHFELGYAGIVDPAGDSGVRYDVPTLTQWYCRMLEKAVVQAPEQYWWVHRLWKSAPPRKQRPRQAQAQAQENGAEPEKAPPADLRKSA